mgnify:CR=1 FL=1
MTREEIVEDLYSRLEASRKLLKAYSDIYNDLSERDRGYRTGINEEILWLEKFLDQIEKS